MPERPPDPDRIIVPGGATTSSVEDANWRHRRLARRALREDDEIVDLALIFGSITGRG